MFNWIEDKSEKRSFEIDYIFYRYLIKTPFISIGERIRIVKYPDSETILIYSRVVGMNEKYMFRDTLFCNYITFMCKKLDDIFSKNEELNGENSIISSRFIKNKSINKIANTHFLSYIRNNKLEELFS